MRKKINNLDDKIIIVMNLSTNEQKNKKIGLKGLLVSYFFV
ncbi:hypothetical protein PROVRUST_06526 [Providencia rustigianii DSM 4541]|uniref:Uncharacterized protein n=1 Tax=Providencia rustigianii DSM 4541 TaxID=500637 RepID=D1P2U6_9GAMM|nr:hypothetical protein PROVRUST_06526 [Providencia rustigianii DSM 4541]